MTIVLSRGFSLNKSSFNLVDELMKCTIILQNASFINEQMRDVFVS